MIERGEQSEHGEWVIMKDDDSHTYIIPADKQGDFELWMLHIYNDDEYNGPGYDEYRLRTHPSCYIFTGVWSLPPLP